MILCGSNGLLTNRSRLSRLSCQASSQAPSAKALYTNPEQKLGALADAETVLLSDKTPLGRGLVVHYDVPGPQAVVSVPLGNALVISDDPLNGISIFGDKCHRLFQEQHGELDPALLEFITGEERWDVRMTAFLLFALRHCGDKRGSALWKQYASVLPEERDMSCLLNYADKEEARQLQLKELQDEAKAQVEWIEYLHDRYFNSRSGLLRELQLVRGKQDTYWATSMVRSRTFSEEVNGEGITLVVPFADLANHSFTYNSTFCMAKDRTRFELRSLAPLSVGCEATISYGEKKCNAELLRDYGFIVPGNPNDRISLPKLSDTRKLNSASLLEAVGMTGDLAQGDLQPTSQAAESRQHAPDSPYWRRRRNAILSLNLGDGYEQSANDSKGQQAGGFFSWPPKAWTSSGSPPPRGLLPAEVPLERQAVEEVRQALRALLAGLPTTLDTDLQLLGQAAGKGGGWGLPGQVSVMSPRVRQAVVARVEHKQLVTSALDVLDEYEQVLCGGVVV